MQVVYNALNPSAGGPMPKGAPGLDYGRSLDRAKAADMGTIIIRALAGGALAGTDARHPLAMQVVPPIGSAPDFAGDVARAHALEPLVRESGSPSLTELAQRFVIANPNVTTMLVGYSTLDQLEQAIAAVAKGPLPEAILRSWRSDGLPLPLFLRSGDVDQQGGGVLRRADHRRIAPHQRGGDRAIEQDGELGGQPVLIVDVEARQQFTKPQAPVFLEGNRKLARLGASSPSSATALTKAQPRKRFGQDRLSRPSNTPGSGRAAAGRMISGVTSRRDM